MTEIVKEAINKELEEAKLEAEIRQLNAETAKNNAEAAAAEFIAAKLEREDLYERAAADQAGHYSFIGAVTNDSVKSCMRELAVWSRREPECNITILFNSPGGSVTDGLALYDFLDELKFQGHKITTVARGMAASMGGVLLQAGQERVIGRNAHVLIHEVSSMNIGKTSEMEDELKFVLRLQERLLDILAERSSLTKTQIKTRWKRKDWWLSSEECVELGFADRIG